MRKELLVIGGKFGEMFASVNVRQLPNLPEYFIYLPPYDDISKTAKDIWNKRKYGIWPSKKIQEFHQTYNLLSCQKDLFKSYLQLLLVEKDSKYFDNFKQTSKMHRAYQELNEKINEQVEIRELDLKNFIENHKDSNTPSWIFDEMAKSLKDAAIVIANYAPHKEMSKDSKAEHISRVITMRFRMLGEMTNLLKNPHDNFGVFE